MIRVEVKYILKSGCREAFYSSIVSQKIDKAAQNEEGNIRYDFEIPDDEPDLLYLHELWKNAEVLEAHSRMSHFKAHAELKAKYVVETVIEKEEI